MTHSLDHLPSAKEVGTYDPATLKHNFSDLHPPLTPRQAIIESQRCLYCYDAPCVEACPSEIDIPSFIRQISESNINGAAETILEANILGGSCARVCPPKSSANAAVCVTMMLSVSRCSSVYYSATPPTICSLRATRSNAPLPLAAILLWWGRVLPGFPAPIASPC